MTSLLNEAANATEGEVPAQTAADSSSEVVEQTSADKEATQSDAKADGTKPDESKADDKGAKESYEFTAPEGVDLGGEVIAEFSKVAQEQGIPVKAAQAVLDRVAPVIRSQFESQIVDAVAKQSEAWAAEVQKHADFGGQKLKESQRYVKAAIDANGSKELLPLLERYGLTNNPEIYGLLVRYGKAVSPDMKLIGSNGGEPVGGHDAAASFFRNMRKG